MVTTADDTAVQRRAHEGARRATDATVRCNGGLGAAREVIDQTSPLAPLEGFGIDSLDVIPESRGSRTSDPEDVVEQKERLDERRNGGIQEKHCCSFPLYVEAKNDSRLSVDGQKRTGPATLREVLLAEDEHLTPVRWQNLHPLCCIVVGNRLERPGSSGKVPVPRRLFKKPARTTGKAPHDREAQLFSVDGGQVRPTC